jgi:hypothetical protein
MILKFLNGNNVQKKVVQQTLDELLHFPTDSIGLATWEFEFTADPDAGKTHTEFAITEYAYSSGVAKTKMRSDFPHFPVPWNGLGFARECVAHEFFHAVFANLPAGTRNQIAQLFGAPNDNLPALNDPSKPWELRAIEGIAETAKDAFLPQRFRKFSNRTKRRIPIKDYPEFRELFRGSEAGGGKFSYVYGSSSFRVDRSAYGFLAPPLHLSDFDPEAFVFYRAIPGFEECWGVDMSQFTESGTLPFSITLPEEGAS